MSFDLILSVSVRLPPWTTLEEDYIAFLLPAPKCINCIKTSFNA
jgi:hypothetical protein